MPIHTKRASSTTSSRRPTSQAFSTGSSISDLPRASTSSCRGHGRRRPHPIASPPDPQRQLTKAVGRKRRLRWPIVSERWSESKSIRKDPRARLAECAFSQRCQDARRGPVKGFRTGAPCVPSGHPKSRGEHASEMPRRRLTGVENEILRKKQTTSDAARRPSAVASGGTGTQPKVDEIAHAIVCERTGDRSYHRNLSGPK